MIRVQPVGRRGIMRDDQVRFVYAHLAHQFAPQHQCWFNFTVRPAQESYFIDAHDARSFTLFSLTYWPYLLRGQYRIAGAFVARRAKHKSNLSPGIHETTNRACRSGFDVVRMRYNHQHTLYGGRFEINLCHMLTAHVVPASLRSERSTNRTPCRLLCWGAVNSTYPSIRYTAKGPGGSDGSRTRHERFPG